MTTYTPLRTFPSSSSDKVYTVKRNVETGELSCDCMAWRMKKPGQERGCKHTAEVLTDRPVLADQPSVYNAKLAANTPPQERPGTTPFLPMLADSSPVPFDDPAFVYEPKLDGLRAIAEISTHGVNLWGRNGTNYGSHFPEVTPALYALIKAGGYLVLDGEIVAYKNGVADFGATNGRAHSNAAKARLQAQAQPAVYHAFDVLQVGPTALLGVVQRDRRTLLEALLTDRTGPHLSIVPQRTDGSAFFQDIIAAGGEGIMAKRRDGLYRPGKRHSDWTKIKGVQEETFYVVGLTKGTGWREGMFGAVVLAGTDARGRLVEVGEAGTGFDNAALAQVLEAIKPHVAYGPPPGIKARSDIQTWLRPILRAEIKFHARTADGKLRFPVFKGLRHDL